MSIDREQIERLVATDRERLRDLVAEHLASEPRDDWGEDEPELMRDLERFAATGRFDSLHQQIRRAARARKARRGWR